MAMKHATSLSLDGRGLLAPRARPVRVAIVSPTFGGYGGMEAFVLAVAGGLPDTPALEVRLYFKRTKGFVLQPELTRALAALGGRVKLINRGGADLWRAIASADIVHALNPSPDVVMLAKLCCRPLLINVINHRQPGHSWKQRLWDFGLRQADRRFYISDFVRTTWEKSATAWPRSEVVFPICELTGVALPPAQRRGFVFAARWIPNKGLETLVEAYAQAGLDPGAWPLRLIGDGPLRPAIQQRIAVLGVQGIEAPGFLTQAAKAEAIRSARWMVVPPDTREDFGLTAIEARYVEVPCIITRDGGVPEAAGAEALSCAPGDVAGLAECLRAAAAMPEADYTARAKLTRATLLPRLRGSEFYAGVYREMAQR